MSVDLAQAVWEELKRYIGSMDRVEAADALVSLLVDSNFDSDEIRDAFRGDHEVKKALNVYLKDHADAESDNESDDDNDNDDDDTDWDDR
jgi:hypothetical protein